MRTSFFIGAEKEAEFLDGELELKSSPSRVTAIKRQLARYALIGAATNVSGYLLYLWLTFQGLGPKAAATICFVSGVAAGFILNRKWTFRDPRRFLCTFPRYIAAYGIAYTLNIGGLYVLVDMFKFRHEVVQIILVLLIACGLFLAQKLWIFSSGHGHEQA